MKVLTAEEVRALPVGSIVRVHGLDKFKYPCFLDMKVIQKDKHKELECFDYYLGQSVVKKIKKMPENDPYHYYELREGGSAGYV